MLGAQRSMSMAIQEDGESRLEHIDLPPPPRYSGMMTQRLEEPIPPCTIMTRSRARARGRGYQLHRGLPQSPVRRPYSDTDTH